MTHAYCLSGPRLLQPCLGSPFTRVIASAVASRGGGGAPPPRGNAAMRLECVLLPQGGIRLPTPCASIPDPGVVGGSGNGQTKAQPLGWASWVVAVMSGDQEQHFHRTVHEVIADVADCILIAGYPRLDRRAVR